MGDRIGCALVLAAGLFFSTPAPVSAQSMPPAENEVVTEQRATGGQITVYGWLAGAAGEITPIAGAPTLEFDNSFGEVLADLDAAFFVTGLVRKDRLVFVGDVSYAALSREGIIPPGVPASGEVSQFSATLAGGARVSDRSGLTVDVLVGARFWNVETQVDVPLAGVSVSPEKTFVDPVIAARTSAPIAANLSATVYADLGGLGVGSDITYQIAGTLNYRIGRATYISAGYRHLYLDFDDDGTVFKGSQTGPLIGLTQRF